MKVGLSTWSLLSMDLLSAIQTIGDAGFDYIELWGEAPHAHPGWTNKKALKDALSTYNLLVTLHAPFTDLNPASPFQPVKGAVEKTLESFVTFGDDLGATIITIHPGSVHSEAMIPTSAESSVVTLRKMVKVSGGRLAINVENQTKSRSKYHFPLASTAESLDLILAEVDGLGFTLDTGHAHANGQNPVTLAQRAGPRLTEVHLSDNGGTSDDHLIPGEGTADLNSILSEISGKDILVCLELDPHRYTTETVLHAASELKSRLAAPQA
ncbi:MAG: sugar phosphate isomerase/epimerase [Thaumarchaeota archaeon]|nr:sugar phosphate isomerase/epimerase [Nitrososphaerota archaeon]